ncbi:MAG: relaxase/mobilization nuclease domain-containing protein [Acutalibacteraceae bacterium]
MFVTGINCEAENVYKTMTETKRQFGKSGKVVAYHGYQSLKEGEVTPEECHAIGVETATPFIEKSVNGVFVSYLDCKLRI